MIEVGEKGVETRERVDKWIADGEESRFISLPPLLEKISRTASPCDGNYINGAVKHIHALDQRIFFPKWLRGLDQTHLNATIKCKHFGLQTTIQTMGGSTRKVGPRRIDNSVRASWTERRRNPIHLKQNLTVLVAPEDLWGWQLRRIKGQKKEGKFCRIKESCQS